jgi:undecaprenyl-diphosphatase
MTQRLGLNAHHRALLGRYIRLVEIAGTARRVVERAHGVIQVIRGCVALTPQGFAWLLIAVASLVGCLTVLGGVGQDVVSHDGQYRTDPAHLSWFVAHRNLLDVDAAKLLAIVGSVGVLVGLAVLAAAVLVLRRVPLALAITPLLAVTGAGAVAGIVKTVVGRGRPAATLRLAAESGASFPSGHTTDTTALVLALTLVIAIVILRRQLVRALTIVAGTVVSVSMGASRLLLGVHWPTDVIAGMALGAAVALATVIAAVVVTRITPPADARRTTLLVRLASWSRPAIGA